MIGGALIRLRQAQAEYERTQRLHQAALEERRTVVYNAIDADGLTHDQVAAALGVTRSLVTKMMTARRKPSA